MEGGGVCRNHLPHFYKEFCMCPEATPAPNPVTAMLRYKQVATRLGVCERYVRDLCTCRRIRATRIGKHAVRISEAELARFIAEAPVK